MKVNRDGTVTNVNSKKSPKSMEDGAETISKTKQGRKKKKLKANFWWEDYKRINY